MPTEYTNCDECNYLYWLSLDHEKNKQHKKNVELEKTLIEIGFPTNLVKKIIKYSHEVKPCDYCKKATDRIDMLCEEHYQRALRNGFHYRKEYKAMCNKCCWFEVS